jgi:hypothetical protein
VAVVLAAGLFPAAGFGQLPGWSADPAVVPGVDGPTGAPGPTDAPADGPTTPPPRPPDGETTPDPTTTNPTGTTTTTTRDATTTDPTTTRETTPPVTDQGNGGDGGFVEAFLVVTLWVLAAAAGVGFFLAAGTATGHVEWHRRPDDGFSLSVLGVEVPLGRAVGRVPQVTTAFLVGTGSTLSNAFDGVGDLVSGLAAGSTLVAGGLVRGTGRALSGLPTALSAFAGAAGSGVLSIGGGLGGFLAGLSTPFGGDGGTRPRRDARVRGGDRGNDDGDANDDGPPVPGTVREAWTLLVGRVPTRRRSMTPAEVARRAVDAGLPAGPVRRLTELFREVRYGGRSEDGSRLRAAREAIAAVFEGGER